MSLTLVPQAVGVSLALRALIDEPGTYLNGWGTETLDLEGGYHAQKITLEYYGDIHQYTLRARMFDQDQFIEDPEEYKPGSWVVYEVSLTKEYYGTVPTSQPTVKEFLITDLIINHKWSGLGVVEPDSLTGTVSTYYNNASGDRAVVANTTASNYDGHMHRCQSFHYKILEPGSLERAESKAWAYLSSPNESN